MVATVRCGDEDHQIERSGGRLRLLQHDLRTELAQSTLAGRVSCRCLWVALLVEYEVWGIEEDESWYYRLDEGRLNDELRDRYEDEWGEVLRVLVELGASEKGRERWGLNWRLVP